ncbi:unnamed protein product [Amoebophrya sp. A25]|nr:unnamed protein product [Amoebophrya sp. A25]|eukprot:GSA25T00009287001.1
MTDHSEEDPRFINAGRSDLSSGVFFGGEGGASSSSSGRGGHRFYGGEKTAPPLHSVLRVRVASIVDFGAFVQPIVEDSRRYDDDDNGPEDDRRYKQGLLHKSRISGTTRVEKITDFITEGEQLFVKVVEVGGGGEKGSSGGKKDEEHDVDGPGGGASGSRSSSSGGKYSVDMRFVQQATGRDQDPDNTEYEKKEAARKGGGDKGPPGGGKGEGKKGGKKKGGFRPDDKIELGAIHHNVTCTRCGATGHIALECFASKKYDLIPEDAELGGRDEKNASGSGSGANSIPIGKSFGAAVAAQRNTGAEGSSTTGGSLSMFGGGGRGGASGSGTTGDWASQEEKLVMRRHISTELELFRGVVVQSQQPAARRQKFLEGFGSEATALFFLDKDNDPAIKSAAGGLGSEEERKRQLQIEKKRQERSLRDKWGTELFEKVKEEAKKLKKELEKGGKKSKKQSKADAKMDKKAAKKAAKEQKKAAKKSRKKEKKELKKVRKEKKHAAKKKKKRKDDSSSSSDSPDSSDDSGMSDDS